MRPVSLLRLALPLVATFGLVWWLCPALRMQAVTSAGFCAFLFWCCCESGPTGVCCVPGAGCFIYAESTCTASSGVWAPALTDCTGIDCSGCSCCLGTPVFPPAAIALTFPADSAGGARTVIAYKTTGCGYSSPEVDTSFDYCTGTFPTPATIIQVVTAADFQPWQGDSSAGGSRSCADTHINGLHLLYRFGGKGDVVLSVPT